MTTYLGLTKPTPLVTAGPAYATTQNADLDLIDAHDHTSGKGKQVPHGGGSSGTVIAGDFSYTGYGPVAMSYARFTTTGSHPVALTGLHVYNNDLWYQNSTGGNVQITSGATLQLSGVTNANSGFYGDYAGHTAVATLDYANNQYLFYRDNSVTLATLVSNGLYVKKNGSQPIKVGTAFAAGTTTGGFAFDNASNTFVALLESTASSGTYDAKLIKGSLATGTHPRVDLGEYYGTVPTVGVSLSFAYGNANAINDHSAFIYRASNGAAYQANTSGWRIRFLGETGTAGGNDYMTYGAIQPFVSDPSAGALGRGGIRISAARGTWASPTYNSSAFIELNDSGSTIGLGGAGSSNSTFLITAYGGIYPNANKTIDLGTSGGLEWRTLYAGSGQFSTALGAPSQATDLYRVGKNNVCLAWATITVAAGVATLVSSYNVASVAYNSAGNTTVTYSQAIGNTTYCPVVTPLPGGAIFSVPVVTAKASTTATVQTYNSSAAATDCSYQLVVFGSPT